ncbi:trypsin-like serine peptidase [Alkalihalophilus marmarensis]|uniref:Trypsin n=1 Tax=Alkalihalophilus marmarensis DSM 21297 TaxID=1188261 RepID=U6SJX1_9BACI|nr:hypothetical protein [Alkalihalophilus marmarensis]ERN52019.1 hypothetical protein A33I_18170 [Alkalihalophilus marmarensis DSM 21297]
MIVSDFYDSKSNLLSLGKIAFKVGKKQSFGSACLVKAPSNSIMIATAAHCIYDWETKNSFKDLHFIPAFEPEVRIPVQKCFVPKMWGEHSAVEFDTAFLELDVPAEKFDLYERYSITPVFNIDKELDYLVYGYFPDLFLRPTKKQYMSRGKASQDIFKDSTLQGVKSKVKSGMSGGPWLTVYNNQLHINSVSSLSFKKVKNIIWGPYWGETIQNTYFSQINPTCDETIIVDLY